MSPFHLFWPEVPAHSLGNAGSVNASERRVPGQRAVQQEPLGFTPKRALGDLMVPSFFLGWQIFPGCLETLSAVLCSQLLLTCGK